MKRVLCLLVAVCVLLSGCVSPENPPEAPSYDVYVKGVWFTYSEIDAMLGAKDFKAQFQKADHISMKKKYPLLQQQMQVILSLVGTKEIL